jgi:hypothetical protein
MQCRVLFLFEINTKKYLLEKNYFATANIQFLAERKSVNYPLGLEQYVILITINNICSLIFKVAELNYFRPTASQDRYRLKQLVLWVLTTKFDAATF